MIFAFIGIVIIMTILITLIKNKIGVVMNDVKTSYELNIGEKCVYDGDTLEIVDYNSFNSIYVLSNGKEVNKAYVEKKIIK